MKARDSQSHKWSEADVDSLLTEFFRAEMPAALRQLPAPVRSDRLQPVAVRSDRLQPVEYGSHPLCPAEAGHDVRGRERRAAGFKSLTAAACALLLAVMALSPAGRQLVAPDRGDAVAVRPTETQDKTAVAKNAGANNAATASAMAGRQPAFTLPRELRNALPPELRPREYNAAPVTSGDGDPLDLRELLRIEVFEPRDASKTRRTPRKRPRLPEER